MGFSTSSLFCPPPLPPFPLSPLAPPPVPIQKCGCQTTTRQLRVSILDVDFQIGCCTPEEVRQNVANVIAAFGERSDKEDQVLREVKDILRPIQGQTWPSGLPENN